MEEAVLLAPEGALGAAHLLAAASVGFVLALVLSAWAPSLALLIFSPKRQLSTTSTTRASSLGPTKRFIATDPKALRLPAEDDDGDEEEEEEEGGASKGQGKAKECHDGHQAQPKAKETSVASMDPDEVTVGQGQPHGEERGHNNEGDYAQDSGGHAAGSSSTLSSSPSFPRLVQAPTSPSSPVPSSPLRRAVTPAPSASSPAPPSPAVEVEVVASPSLGSSVSYPPHSAAPSEYAPASTASSSLAAPPARLMKRQTTVTGLAKSGRARDMEATSCLPNPAVQQWWEMERLLEKEYATIEEKAFGVMMKLMPFRSGEGLKDPPKIVPNPYHGNRVILEPLEGALPEHDTTFYNASYIRKGQFIAASMPHNDLTRQDFWRMIYEQDCRLIVMLNLEDESHGDPYWPNELNNTTHYGPMAITKTEQMRMRFYESTVRKFTISRTDRPDAPSKQVLHVHNTVWPDKGIPENVEAFTDMVEYVKQEYEQLCENKTGPMTVHCFGGIGRTGSFLTCMICLLSIREIQEASVFSTVLNLRTDRAMMVQTTEQYKFCYRVVMELFSRSKRKALHRGLSGVLRRSAKPKPGAAIATPAAALLSVPAPVASVKAEALLS